MKTNPTNYQFSTSINRIYAGNRNIPTLMKLKIWLSNVLTMIGLAFFIMGLPFSFIFLSTSTIFDPSFSDKDPIINATATEAKPTNSYINNARVYEYKYEYQTKEGKTYSGYGYSTGNLFSLGDELQIHYKADNPEFSKALDLRTSEFGGGLTLFVLIFPLIGLIMLFFITRKALKQMAQFKNNVGEKILYLAKKYRNQNYENN